MYKLERKESKKCSWYEEMLSPFKTKEEVKRDLGRSPDYRDALLMRVFFDLKKPKLNLKTTWS